MAIMFALLMPLFCVLSCAVTAEAEGSQDRPDVLAVILASNEAHLLSTFFGSFEQLTYPKQNIGLWIRSDHNYDDTPHMLDVWLQHNADLYHSVSVDIRMLPRDHSDNPTNHSWPVSRYETLIKHKQNALSYARKQDIPYIWFVDTDAFLTNHDVLQDLMAENKTIIAPLLQSLSLYSNFWGEMDGKGYYVRSSNYQDIVERELKGTHPAALVHSAVLVDLRYPLSEKLTFRREFIDSPDVHKIPVDDIIVFARSAQKANIDQFVTNKQFHGWLLPAMDNATMENQELINLKVDVTHKSEPLPESAVLQPLTRKPVKDSLGVDQVYLINLERRRNRRDRMKYCFSELGVRFRYLAAVDGQELSSEKKQDLGIQQLPNYRDPYKERNITFGEIGCFLSHFKLWQDIVDQDYREAIVFEDDIHFVPNFRSKLDEVLRAIRAQGQLDFVYFGRKNLANASEPFLPGTDRLVAVDYSYWTLSYYITKQGAQKLLDGEPLSKMVPVDEYIPIMFDRHPRSDWKDAFQPRTLRAASAYPLLVYPTHYTGEENYFSDTENSPLAEPAILPELEDGQLRSGIGGADMSKEEL